jgi:hypothetical protein
VSRDSGVTAAAAVTRRCPAETGLKKRHHPLTVFSFMVLNIYLLFICYLFVICNFDFLTSVSLTAVCKECSFDISTLLSLIIVRLTRNMTQTKKYE